ncbi:conserved hypothetical protein [Neospora caninum Liverpool]|uniref:Transmembrane protein n=1 Tax=Neospora caninum (strain Liverpool) TaxID=572307 RepID=F0V7I7_NEOCL|nr:conserved hypothetical protein [Neospora caninum Liverpool]CBZ49678.1 conserved hypothetical protein [Neospora caninum Liverpool]CEL64262.1 TPA: hypothetical protein BN1204_001660 [Neospora caninum Liverpool]|eukprot:XP_003879713.1 conserved hypothetical protein [Neospora caninum Liverpool]
MSSRASLGRPGVPGPPGRPRSILLLASLCSCLFQELIVSPVSAFRRSEGNLVRGTAVEKSTQNTALRWQPSGIDGRNHFHFEPVSFLGLLGDNREDEDGSASKTEDSATQAGSSTVAAEEQKAAEAESQQSESQGTAEKGHDSQDAPHAEPAKSEEQPTKEAHGANGKGVAASGQDDTVTGEGKKPEELTEQDFKQMSTSQGLSILLGQGKGMMQEAEHTLDGVNAVVSITDLMGKVRDDIRKDVEALNRTVTEEYQNIEQLRQLQDAQTAVLRSQLNYLIPLNRPEAPAQPEVAATAEQSGSSSSISFYGVFGAVCVAVVTIFLSEAHISSGN